MAGESYLIAGLGNIGPEYELSRHNMGFMALDAWAKASGAVFYTRRYGDLAEISLKGRSLYLLKPSTYMNLSGNAVRYWLGKLPVTEERLMVVCDDINLPFGTLRMRKSGSDGGHNGLKHIDYMLSSDDYARLRVGIGHGFAEGGQIDYVLGEWLLEEKKVLPEILSQAVEAVKCFALEGVDRAMTRYNHSVIES